jgi:folate-binding protein YgfZ
MLDIPGAVAADKPDQDVAAHYGEPMQEQRALEAGEAFVDRSDRGVIRVSGPDRLSWLHSLLSQQLDDLPPGEPAEALLLSPNGHVEHHLHLTDDGEAVWIHVEPGTAPALAGFLDKMRFMLRVEVADLSEDYAVVSYGVDDDKIVPMAEVSAQEGRPAGLWAYEALRIAAHRPRLGFDTDHKTIPHEVGWIERAVHLNKGCYRGQETVARVHNLGRPPRRLVFLHLDGSVDHLPAHGDPITLDGREVGFVGSAARHHELGPIALALVKRTVPVEADLLAGGVAASQEVVVSPDTGANVTIDLRRRPRA